MTDIPIPHSFTYAEYIRFVNNLVSEGKTSGDEQSQSLIEYTKLNQMRMRRLTKTASPSEKIIAMMRSAAFNMRWIVITEAWCGDAAQNLPFIAKLATLCTRCSLGIVLRDKHKTYMDQFLTEGARSIPKLIVYKEDNMEILDTWGPRPAKAHALVQDYQKKSEPKVPFDKFAEQLHRWYTSNNNQDLEEELCAIFERLIIAR